MLESPFVLCRLFRKQEEKADVSKYDEVENTGSSPTATEMAQVQRDFEKGASGWFNGHVDERELLQMQPLFGSSQAHVPLVDQELNRKIEWDIWDNPVQYVSSSALNLKELADKTNRVNNGSIPVGGTGIKIRTRQPQQQPILNNFGSLGTAQEESVCR
ncbi:uncharacterized protein LOC133852384 isoform X2 [Alnus glutinosa]|uniref:uncharacterized protein LOC133852384 isoform X2 n=1 Tax=Alnus glutinosa TaxID=3517 RepID=UPI002D79C746|nr:uncharacterized protein LOC133852384 isoform X2 [Alnus glutinosa]